MIVNSAEIWAGDGDSTLKVFANADPYPLLTVVSTGGTMRLDEMPFIDFWNIATHTIIKKMPFDGSAGNGPNATDGIEQCSCQSADRDLLY